MRLRRGDFAQSTVFSDDPVAQARAFAEGGATVAPRGRPGRRARGPAGARRARREHRRRLPRDGAPGRRAAVARRDRDRDGHGRRPRRRGDGGGRGPPSCWSGRSTGSGTRWWWASTPARARSRPTAGPRSPTATRWRSPTELVSMGVRRLAYTDINRDGTLGGPNLAALRRLAEAAPPLRLIASGGVSSLDDLRRLRDLGARQPRRRDRRPRPLRGALHGGRGPGGARGAEPGVIRVIPCLDVDRGRVVKGVNFVGLRDAGDPVELAARYDREGADELVFLDITASHEERGTIVELARRTAEEVFIPFTIGGGLRSEEDIRAVLAAGADKVSLNSAAVRDPELIARGVGPIRRPVHRGRHRRQAARGRLGLGGLPQRRAPAHRPRGGRLGGRGRRAGGGGAAGHEHGPRRHPGRLRRASCSRPWPAPRRSP